MSSSDVTTRWFEVLDESASMIAEKESTTYLDGLYFTAENIASMEIQYGPREELEKLYAPLYKLKTTPEEVRRAMQLALLKGMKGGVQAHHQMTPDAVALFMAYLVNQLRLPDGYSVLDPAVGTANLLTALLNQTERKIGAAFGVEVDELLVKLAAANADLQQHEIELYHQDSLRPLLIDPVDLIVADLPVGYYPDDENAKNFQLGAQEGRPFAHFLFIEKGLNHAKPGGYLLFLVPNNLFESDRDKRLHKLIKDEAHILGFLQLPLSIFKNKEVAKSIMLLQKKGEGIQPPKQALLAELPSFQDPKRMASAIAHINRWFEERRSEGARPAGN